ncbi:hypothetical protein F5Y09DRAFT_293418 [Xylaria sp. FL1042]|nr:hypothetical protein F5Y09DRAFT_1663 [Xylaria sp. FL1042]KAI0435365.1 hypothetical protein F5Y09DRAFT_293418 [Xylaria sp. FL1042]
MICSTAYAVLVVGLASRILAEPYEPYQPSLARMSTRNIFGLHRRGVEGYAPTEEICGDGHTCAEACGKGFQQCHSKDDLTHCYNQSKQQTCCPNGSGDACDNGYFCTADDDAKTWCCPDGLSLTECAKKYNIPGPLTSQIVSTSTTTTKATTTKHTSSEASHTSKTEEATTTKHTSTKESSKEPTTTSTKIRKPGSTTVSKTSHHESTSESEVKETSTTASSPASTTTPADVTGASISTEAIMTTSDSVPTSTPPASSTSSISQGGSGSHGPISGFVLFVAGALAAFI